MTYEDKQSVDNKDTDDMIEPVPASSRLIDDHKKELEREKLAIYLLSRDEEMTIREAAVMWQSWVKDSLRGHDGDCTKQPQPCSACLVERYRTDANSILRITQEAGYVKLIPHPLKGTPWVDDIGRFVDSASENMG